MDDTYFNENQDWDNLDIEKEQVVISGEKMDEAYKRFVTITTFGDLKNSSDKALEGKEECPECWRAGAKAMFEDWSVELKKYTPDELMVLAKNNDDKFLDWTTKLVEYYCLRQALFQRNGKPIKKFRIPVTPLRTLEPSSFRDACVDAYNENQKKIDENNDE